MSNLSSYEQNEVLLDYLCDEEITPEPLYKLDRFIEALNKTHQQHLAALLLGIVKVSFISIYSKHLSFLTSTQYTRVIQDHNL